MDDSEKVATENANWLAMRLAKHTLDQVLLLDDSPFNDSYDDILRRLYKLENEYSQHITRENQ